VIRPDKETPTERRLEGPEQALELLSALEIPPVEDETAGTRLAEEAYVLVPEDRPWNANHQLLADQVREIGHGAIVSLPHSRGSKGLSTD
jgi:hypothetical protein